MDSNSESENQSNRSTNSYNQSCNKNDLEQTHEAEYDEDCLDGLKWTKEEEYLFEQRWTYLNYTEKEKQICRKHHIPDISQHPVKTHINEYRVAKAVQKSGLNEY